MLKEYRTKLKMTQAQVADIIGVSQPTYQKYENGTLPVPEVAMAKLREVFKESILEVNLEQSSAWIDDYLEELYPGMDSDEYTYYGEISIYFKSGTVFMASITEGQRSFLLDQMLKKMPPIIAFSTMNNRSIIARTNEIVDIVFSADSCDESGLDLQKYDFSIDTIQNSSHAFWTAIERHEEIDFEDADSLKEELGSLYNKSLAKIISDTIKEDDFNLDNYIYCATGVRWTTTTGEVRSSYQYEEPEIAAIYQRALKNAGRKNGVITFREDGNFYHRAIIVISENISFMSFPTHKLNS